VYPWISESFNLIQSSLPCSVDEATAKLIELLPQRAVDAALRFKSDSRYRAAKLALRHLIGSRLTLEGEFLVEKISVRSIGDNTLQQLKSKRVIDKNKTGFAKSSRASYQSALLTLGWITVEGTLWRWIGPDNAEWKTVTEENRRKKRT
jgi:hypothetical protein